MSILADLNDCSVEEIAKVISKSIDEPEVVSVANGSGYDINQRKTFYKAFGKRLKNARVRMNMTERDLAKVLDVNPYKIKIYERGEHIPSAFLLKNISEVLGVSADKLLREIDGNDKRRNP